MTQFDREVQALIEEGEVAELEKLNQTVARFSAYLSERGLATEAPEATAEEIMIIVLAGLWYMGDTTGLSTRKDAEKVLWDAGMLQGVWLDLVAGEFNGAGMTDAELDQHIATLAGRYVANVKMTKKLAAQTDQYRQFLVAHGHSIRPLDEVLMVVFAQMKLVPASPASRRSSHEEALIHLANSRRGNSDAWHLLIDHEFLGWF